MEKTIKILNEIKRRGLIKTYAIGGGIATIFYTEPTFTYDLDVFLLIDVEAGKKIVSLAPIYDYLKEKGCCWKGEHIVVEGMPVQFIPAGGGLEESAIKDARTVSYGRVKTKVLRAEHLIAIALKVGRGRDLEKIDRLLDQAKIDRKKLDSILKEFNLSDKFEKWKERLK